MIFNPGFDSDILLLPPESIFAWKDHGINKRCSGSQPNRGGTGGAPASISLQLHEMAPNGVIPTEGNDPAGV